MQRARTAPGPEPGRVRPPAAKVGPGRGVAALTLVALALRLSGLARQSIWVDETVHDRLRRGLRRDDGWIASCSTCRGRSTRWRSSSGPGSSAPGRRRCALSRRWPGRPRFRSSGGRCGRWAGPRGARRLRAARGFALSPLVFAGGAQLRLRDPAGDRVDGGAGRACPAPRDTGPGYIAANVLGLLSNLSHAFLLATQARGWPCAAGRRARSGVAWRSAGRSRRSASRPGWCSSGTAASCRRACWATPPPRSLTTTRRNDRPAARRSLRLLRVRHRLLLRAEPPGDARAVRRRKRISAARAPPSRSRGPGSCFGGLVLVGLVGSARR